MALHKGSDINAAAGHSIPENGAGWKARPDCPACKYGTLIHVGDDKTMQCIDCNAVYAIKRLVELRVLPNTAYFVGGVK